MNCERRWHLLYTRTNQETKVSEQLAKRKIESFVPLNNITGRGQIKRARRYKPLLPGYVFVYVNESGYSTVRQTLGVINFVYWLGNPVIIKGEEVNMIRNFLNDYPGVAVEQMKVNAEEKARVKLVSKSLIEDDVMVEYEQVTAYIPSLGYVITAEGKSLRSSLYNQSAPSSQLSKIA